LQKRIHSFRWSLAISFFVIILCGFAITEPYTLSHSSWMLNCVRLDNDTIFYRSDSTHTMKYNFKLNVEALKSGTDSSSIAEMATKNFHSSRSVRITFETDSTFIMTKIRSGGRITPNEVDSGIYNIKNDTVLFTISTRRNHQMVYKLNPSTNLLFIESPGPSNQNVYSEYIRE